MRPVGAFYNVGAGRTMSLPGDVPFGLALPVPAGADTAHLGVAVLSVTDRMLESVGGDPWMPTLGFYNPETNLFSFALSTLFVEGGTVVLVEDPDLAPLSEAVVTLKTTGDVPQDVPQFAIYCHRFTDPSKCQHDDEIRLNRLLQAAHDEYLVTLKYAKPNLITRSYIYSGEGLTSVPSYYSRVIARELGVDPCDEKRLGYYFPSTDMEMPTIRICYNRETDENRLKAAIRHEVFHSFQYSPEYKLSEGGKLPPNFTHEQIEDFKWIQEGTASAAEESSEDTMRRSKFDAPPLHPINRALVAADQYTVGNTVPTPSTTSIEYSAQEFWVKFGKKNNLGLGYLKELFARGASPDAADTFFKDVYHTSLASEYWAWVKNQAIEKTINFDGALLGPECSIELPRDIPVVGKPRPQFSIPTPLSFPTLTFPGSEGPVAARGTLRRLTAKVVKVDIVRDVGRITVTAGPLEGGLDYKVYLDKEVGCAEVPDGVRTFAPPAGSVGALKAGSVVYIILANNRHEPGNRIRYRVEVKFDP
jgi:hypothetical protein